MKDNKKTIVLAALGIALLAIGAFQFIGKGKGSAPAEDPAAAGEQGEGQVAEGNGESLESDPIEQALVAMLSGPLPARDPFQASPGMDFALTQPSQDSEPAPSTTSNASNSGPRNFNPPSMPPFDPTGQLPLPGSDETGTATIEGAPPLRVPGEFAYSLRGVVVGDKSVAVFEDDFGNQTLVPLGGSIGQSSKVKSIDKKKVTVEHKGKTITLNLEGGTQ